MNRNVLSDDLKKNAEKSRAPARTVQQASAEGASSADAGLTRGQRNLLTTQRTLGNRAVLRMIQRDPADDPAPADPGNAAPADSQSLSGGGNSVSVSSSGVNISSGAPVTISAPTINLSAAMVNSDAAMLQTAGVLKGSTLIADAVIAASYTPGAGNVW